MRIPTREISAYDEQWEAWKKAARLAGVPLREWIRDILNAEAEEVLKA